MVRSANIWFTAPGTVEVRVEDVDEPSATEVVVQAGASLISTGTECIVLNGLFEPGTHWASWARFPFPPGYSMVGRVVAAGPSVEGCKVGDRLAVRAPHRQFIRTSSWTAVVPDGVADADAAWFGLACIVQNGVRRARITLGDHVVVVGVGILGLLVCQYALACGAQSVVAVDTAEERLTAAMAHGATHAVAGSAAAARDEVAAITGGRLADVVFDVTGHPEAFAQALGLVRRLGRMVLLGDSGTPTRQHLTSDLITRGIELLGAHDGNPPAEGNDYYYWSHRHMAELFFTLVRQRRMDVAAITSHVVSPSDAPNVYAALTARRADHLGVVFDWTRL